MKRFNDWFGDLLSDGLSTMNMFYLIAIIVIFPLFIQRPHDLIGWIQYGTQAFFQGVTLPLLAYTSKKEGKRTNQKLDDIHSWMKESHDRLHKKLDGKKGNK